MIKNQKIPTKLNLITEKIHQFFAWKYHYWITLPLYFILLYVMYFIFAFKQFRSCYRIFGDDVVDILEDDFIGTGDCTNEHCRGHVCGKTITIIF